MLIGLRDYRAIFQEENFVTREGEKNVVALYKSKGFDVKMESP